MKLISKNAEDRYQSAYGIIADLEHCQKELSTLESIKTFVLGEKDVSDKFQIPQKLYGREKEINFLKSAFERVKDGSVELILVSGFPGVGTGRC